MDPEKKEVGLVLDWDRSSLVPMKCYLRFKENLYPDWGVCNHWTGLDWHLTKNQFS